MQPRKASITTLAKATGLSSATVSRALAGAASVLPETRDKVLQAAREQHYVRDRAAVHLKTGKTHTLAFIQDRQDATQLGFKDFLLGLGDALQGTDYHLIVLPQVAGHSALDSVQYVIERGLADGLVLTYTAPQDARVRWLQDQGFPFITYGRTALPAHDSVDFANESFAAMAVATLVAQGRKRLGILLPAAGTTFAQHLADGFARACQQSGVAGEGIAAVSLDDSPEAIYQWTRAQAAAFDGLVLTREAPVLPLLSALADSGLRVGPGQHLELAIKYSSPLPQYIRQPFWACFEDMHRAGHALGSRMLARFAQPDLPASQAIFSPPTLELFHATS
ncbi:LacI family DNA-binding transcriptional regulator [Rhodoferax sp.]|uniref:LacI family DNA-binding transcriptional regulator n=1 Tax=Rhodoferax sp. TaxID=50421 RepID=UPI0025D132A7|nr:LacI family DNA-binding transcriptional regulator [Rhodoferax sp.]